jgi:anthranilate phosphoribosyltransferase
MVGVFARPWIEPLAHVLGALGTERAWVVHGSDGLDEITTSGPTYVASLEGGTVTTFEVKPEDAGLKRATTADLKGGEAAHNAEALRGVLDGKPGAFRDVAILNAAATLVVAGKAKDIKQGAELAAKSVDSGEAKKRLERLVAVSNM